MPWWPSIPPLPEGRGIRNHPRKRSSMRKIAAKLFSTQRGITLKSVMDRSPGTTCASRACNLKLWACDPDNGTVVKICTSCMSALVHLNKFHVWWLKVAHALKYTFLWMWLRRTIARDQRERVSRRDSCYFSEKSMHHWVHTFVSHRDQAIENRLLHAYNAHGGWLPLGYWSLTRYGDSLIIIMVKAVAGPACGLLLKHLGGGLVF